MKVNSLALGLLLFGAQAFSQTPIDTAKLGRNEAVGRYADIRGIKMYYEIYGTGEPLLFIHPNGGSIRSFIYQAPFFEKKFKVILVDSRSQGKTIDIKDSLTYEMMADDFNDLLDYLKIDSCNVIGWSDGGINGLLLAMRHPKKVKKLAATGANLWPDTTALDAWAFDSFTKMRDKLAKLKLTDKGKNRKKLLNLLITEPHLKLDDLKKVKCPTLVMGGDHDVIPPMHTLQIAMAIPKSYLWILPNSGHSTPVYYHDDFNKIVLDFLTTPFRTIKQSGKFK
jgi:pimeloyl-ACP methyl ester carboxylesterase